MALRPTRIEALGLKADVRSGALIRIEDVVMPGTGGAGNGVGLDLVVDSVEVVAHPEGGKPMPLIRTRFDSAWYPGDPPVTATTAAELEALTAANSAQGGSDIPEGWDIVGQQPGQSLEEADAIIRDHMEVAAVYERQQGQRQPPYFSNEISYRDATLSEATTLIYEPTKAGDIVFLIARSRQACRHHASRGYPCGSTQEVRGRKPGGPGHARSVLYPLALAGNAGIEPRQERCAALRRALRGGPGLLDTRRRQCRGHGSRA
ncbi:hypothetical protein [Devosia sp.]|uniref:hypothetical protein n=1 Tax=Devosia sp. TaxID=1871048 RepID=UPI001B11B8E7|nr:hypothetical protein [Devosia sp.]MBO9590290.1 hypothetical protein [Devosia sp.]